MVKKSTQTKNFYFTLFNLLEQGIYPTKIAKFLNCSKQKLNPYISSLKRHGIIKKIGKGAWETNRERLKEIVKISTQVTPSTPPSLFTIQPDKVRGHAFMFQIKLPKIRNWYKREEILKKKEIKYELINKGYTQRIIFKEHKVWLNDKTIVVFWPKFKSYLQDKAIDARNHAIYAFKILLQGLERYLGADLTIDKQYVFKVCRQHYSLVKNALARQYDKEGKKLACYTSQGLWFVIDNSFNLHEAETLHADTSVKDNEKVQDFFNGIKSLEGYTPKFVVNTLGALVNDTASYRKEIRTHIKAIQDLAAGVRELTKKVKGLKK